jgi:hypothetical protein
MSVHSLEDAIRHAFAENVYPGDEAITVYDPGGHDYDETYKLLRGKTWEQMPVATFIQGDTPIPDLTPDAFHYYMPALLLASLAGDADVADSLAFYLSPAAARQTEGEFPYDDTENYNRRLSLFTKVQREAIERVLLEFVARGWIREQDVAETIESVRRGGFA